FDATFGLEMYPVRATERLEMIVDDLLQQPQIDVNKTSINTHSCLRTEEGDTGTLLALRSHVSGADMHCFPVIIL
ncbi:hypothetical protein ACJX0J_014365, partial [Zea mays]